MQHIQCAEFTSFHFSVHYVSQFMQLDPHDAHDIGIRNQRPKLKHVSLVVDDLTLLL